MKNIIQHLGTQNFKRIKVGVGEKPEGFDLADYVLSRFHGEDKEKMEEARKRAAKAAVMIMNEGLQAAMNEYNKKVEE